LLGDRDFDQVCAMDDEDITRDAGCGGHEIRHWIAATAAVGAAGPYDADVRYYRAIPEWLAGFAVITATTVRS
jgi:2,3-dihydroxyphenylpropionate 1,2-dioxygenase